MWRAKYSCLSSRVRSTSWDESRPSPFTTRSWSGERRWVKQCVPLNESVCLFLRDSCVWLLWAQILHMFTSRPVVRSARPSSHMTPTSTYWTDLTSQRHQRTVELSSWRVAPDSDPTRCTPCALLAVVTVGLFRRLTPDALWAGSALTKVKPLHMPLQLGLSRAHTRAHTHVSCTLESES